MDKEAARHITEAVKSVASANLFLVTQFEEGSKEHGAGMDLYPIVEQFNEWRRKYAPTVEESFERVRSQCPNRHEGDTCVVIDFDKEALPF